MAVGLQNLPNVDGPDSDYPYGKVRDKSGTEEGTKANTKTLGDFHQFFARLMDKAGINPNGFPDNDYNGFQYFEALMKVVSFDFYTDDLSDMIMIGVRQITIDNLNTPLGLNDTTDGAILTVIGNYEDETRIQYVDDIVTSARWSRKSTDLGATWSAWDVKKYAELEIIAEATWNMDTDDTFTMAWADSDLLIATSDDRLNDIQSVEVSLKITPTIGPGNYRWQLAGDNIGSMKWDTTNLVLTRKLGGSLDGAGFTTMQVKLLIKYSPSALP